MSIENMLLPLTVAASVTVTALLASLDWPAATLVHRANAALRANNAAADPFATADGNADGVLTEQEFTAFDPPGESTIVALQGRLAPG